MCVLAHSHQFNSFLAGHVLGVEFYHTHCLEPLVDFSSQSLVIVGIVTVAKQASCLHLVLVIVQNMDMTKADDGAEISGVLLLLYVILLND